MNLSIGMKSISAGVSVLLLVACQTPEEKAASSAQQIAAAEAALPSEFVRVKGAELTALVSDKTFRGTSSRNSTMTFVAFRAADGSMIAEASDGTQTFNDKGKWSVSDDVYCEKFNTWVDGARHCYRYFSNGETVMTVSETEPGRIQDGAKLNWRLEPGNTSNL